MSVSVVIGMQQNKITRIVVGSMPKSVLLPENNFDILVI